MIVVSDWLLAQFEGQELTGNEVIALMAFGIVAGCQREPGRTAAQLSEEVLGKFPMVELELALTAFEVALDAVTDARFVAYIPSKGVYRGTVAGRLIASIGADLSSSGGRVAVQRFLHWAAHPEAMEEDVGKAQQKVKETMEQVKAQLKSMISKETLQ